MARYSRTRYRIDVAVLMAFYVALMLLEWPHVRTVQGLGWKIALALMPVLPVAGTIWLMAARVMRSDELEQRVHMIALSLATGVVGVLSLVGGFLAAAGVVALGGDVLIWVYPALCLTYGIAHATLLRRYGGGGCDAW
jgi:hypothetical protein